MPNAVAEGDGPGAAGPEAATSLLERLCSEYKEQMAQLDKERQYVWDNKHRFPRKDATSQLLHGACEKLLREKAALEERRYEEHTAEPYVLFQRLGVDFHRRTSEKASGLLQNLPRRLSGVHERVRFRPSLRSFFGACFGAAYNEADFPHNLSCWNDAQNVFVSTYEVLRDRSFVSVHTSDLVVGDIIYLQRSLRAPCDLRVLTAAEDTLVDASFGSTAPCEVRHCTSQSTASDPRESSNILLKGSFLLQGSLLGVVLRPPQDPFLRNSLRSSLRSSVRSQKDGDFILDTSVPAGMKPSVCQRAYASLCVRASCVCRSFVSMADLASVKTIIVFLSEELYDLAAVRDMVRAMHELGKAVLFVGHDSQALGRCAQECHLEFIDFQGSRSSASTGAPSPSVDSLGSQHEENHGSPANVRPHEHPGPAERETDNCIADLANSCGDKRAFGACLHGISEAALLRFCRLLQERGTGVLYASSQVQPQFLRCVVPPVQWGVNRTLSEELSTCASATFRMRSQSNDTSVAHWPTAVSQTSLVGGTSTSLDAPEEQECTANTLPVLVVSMNTKGVLADLASAVIRKSDLRCLALALQILSKEVLERQER